jgi:hypothetical protein
LIVKAMFGEMGTATALASQRVAPRRLQAAGFEFRFPRLEEALRYELGREEGGETRDESSARRPTMGAGGPPQ